MILAYDFKTKKLTITERNSKPNKIYFGAIALRVLQYFNRK